MDFFPFVRIKKKSKIGKGTQSAFSVTRKIHGTFQWVTKQGAPVNCAVEPWALPTANKKRFLQHTNTILGHNTETMTSEHFSLPCKTNPSIAAGFYVRNTHWTRKQNLHTEIPANMKRGHSEVQIPNAVLDPGRCCDLEPGHSKPCHFCYRTWEPRGRQGLSILLATVYAAPCMLPGTQEPLSKHMCDEKRLRQGKPVCGLEQRCEWWEERQRVRWNICNQITLPNYKKFKPSTILIQYFTEE